jgi:prepilin-type processing-associated H-X9-DG protein
MDSDNVLAYENPENYRSAGTTVLFLDGHAEFMSMDAFLRLSIRLTSASAGSRGSPACLGS